MVSALTFAADLKILASRQIMNAVNYFTDGCITGLNANKRVLLGFISLSG